MFTSKVAVTSRLKVDLNRSRQNIDAFLGVIERRALKHPVLKQTYGGTELNKSIERLSGSGIRYGLIDFVQAPGERSLENLRRFVIESDVIAVFPIKNQASEVLTPGYKRG